MRYFLMILAAGLLSAGLLAGSARPRHTHTRVGSFRCRGYAGQESCLLPPIRPATLSP